MAWWIKAAAVQPRHLADDGRHGNGGGARELADGAGYDGKAHTEVERGKARWLRCGLAKDGSGSQCLVDACSCEDLVHQEVAAAERSCAPWLTQLPARHPVDAGARIGKQMQEYTSDLSLHH
ncbi:unnamed protein product [Urochloa humidicola]